MLFNTQTSPAMARFKAKRDKLKVVFLAPIYLTSPFKNGHLNGSHYFTSPLSFTFPIILTLLLFQAQVIAYWFQCKKYIYALNASMISTNRLTLSCPFLIANFHAFLYHFSSFTCLILLLFLLLYYPPTHDHFAKHELHPISLDLSFGLFTSSRCV